MKLVIHDLLVWISSVQACIEKIESLFNHGILLFVPILLLKMNLHQHNFGKYFVVTISEWMEIGFIGY